MLPLDDDPQAAMLHHVAIKKYMDAGEVQQRMAGLMWGGSKCLNVEGCCQAQRCTMGGLCVSHPREPQT